MDVDKLKMIFGLILLLALCGLLAMIAIGHVYENSSYGLLPLIATLSTLAGAFGNWAFGTKAGNGNGKENTKPKEGKEVQEDSSHDSTDGKS